MRTLIEMMSVSSARAFVVVLLVAMVVAAVVFGFSFDSVSAGPHTNGGNFCMRC